MFVLSRTIARAGVGALAMAMLSLLPGKASAQFNPFNPLNPFNPFNPVVPFPVPVNPNAIGNQGGGVTRATSSLANPINFYQYGQITGVGPIRGTVRIYNQFGLVEQQNQNQGGFGGLFGGLGGIGGNNNQLPGQGATDGDDPPQGVLLHVNYANMFLPNQQQVTGQNRGGFGGFGGGFGGFGGVPGFGFGGPGFGKGAFGNGATGI
jgi:hypothetical protein